MQASNREESFKDPRDGNVYRVVTIGSQTWMAENLRFEIDGSCSYGNGLYGRLYTWDAAMVASPPGWHLPTNDEWETLVTTVKRGDGSSMAARRLKSTNGWRGDGNGMDEYGFSALPGGDCSSPNSQNLYFYGAGDGDKDRFGSWWTATDYDRNNAIRRYVTNSPRCPVYDGHYDKRYGFSVRCVRHSNN